MGIRQAGITILAAGSIGLTACEGGFGANRNETIGTIGGAAGGAIIGSQIGSGTGNLLATALGTVAGALAGRELGRRLGGESADRAASAEQRAMVQNEPVSWADENGARRGTVQPLRTFRNASGQLCRDYTHTVIIDGNPETLAGTACERSGGQWALSG